MARKKRSNATDIGRTRPPRVHIVYKANPDDAKPAVELPFVMGVMSDLSGDSTVPRPELNRRKFDSIDIDNFAGKMKAIAPRATFRVKNTLTGEGELFMDLTFRSMDDFSPAALAKADPALRDLLEARDRLVTLSSYVDGAAGAQKLLDDVLQNPALLEALASAKPVEVTPDEDQNA
ncbi:type VI secretion system contractile sheath small subunit [Caulobacter flavus]|uniref:type VI secretion system contractile sheath small subunit n=1 Tax=Caulobacter flavus TaxID=1679497 RepID=UPI00196B0044|nr:type VI secretion system contractile sheath small subunit [Caulobacter flavus]